MPGGRGSRGRGAGTGTASSTAPPDAGTRWLLGGNPRYGSRRGGGGGRRGDDGGRSDRPAGPSGCSPSPAALLVVGPGARRRGSCWSTTWSSCRASTPPPTRSAWARRCRGRCRPTPCWPRSPPSCRAISCRRPCCWPSCSPRSPGRPGWSARWSAGAPRPAAVAGLVYGWSPFLAERLLMGHWSLLVGYAALPWVARAALDLRAGAPGGDGPAGAGHGARRRWSPTGGLLAAGVAVALGGRRRLGRTARRRRRRWRCPGWWPRVLHPGAAGADPDGVAAFAARAENWAGRGRSPCSAAAGSGTPPRCPAAGPRCSRRWSPLLVVALAAAGWPRVVGRVGPRPGGGARRAGRWPGSRWPWPATVPGVRDLLAAAAAACCPAPACCATARSGRPGGCSRSRSAPGPGRGAGSPGPRRTRRGRPAR